MRPRRPAREDRACPGPLSLPVPSPRTHLGGMSEAPGPAAGGSRGDVAALRCPPPSGPPVGLSCWSVLPASWSRLSPAALSAHSYLERPGPAGAAAAMAPPRGETWRGTAATSLLRTWAGGSQMQGWRRRGRGGAVRRFSLPDVPIWRPKPRTCEPHKPRDFELNDPMYIFLNSQIAPIQRSLAHKEETLVKVDGVREVPKILKKKKIDKIVGYPPRYSWVGLSVCTHPPPQHTLPHSTLWVWYAQNKPICTQILSRH